MPRCRRAQRLEQHGDDPGGRQGDERTPPRRQERADRDHDERVQPHHAERRQPVRERAADEDLDVPEAVAEDRDGERAGQGEECGVQSQVNDDVAQQARPGGGGGARAGPARGTAGAGRGPRG